MKHIRRHVRGLYAPELLENRIAPATFIVTSLFDDGSGGDTLREQIVAANAHPGADTIVFRPGMTGEIILLGTPIGITDTITIKGPGADKISINGNAMSNIFDINNNADADKPAAISGLTLHNGKDSNGGAIYSRESLTLTKVVVTGNTVTNAGGGVCINQGSPLAKLIVKECQFTGNTSAGGGGGLYADVDGPTSISKSTFEGNTSTNGNGGAIKMRNFNTKASITLDDLIVVGNSAGISGGGIALDHNIPLGKLIVKNSVITGNTAADDGGGLVLFGGNLAVTKTVFSNNSAKVGGGMSVRDSDGLVIKGSTFTGNAATDAAGKGGGGLHLEVSQAPITVDTSVFLANTSAADGGGISDVASVLLTVKGSRFDHNTAQKGGALRTANDASLSLTATTISGNVALSAGGGIYASDGGDVKITGGAFLDNRALAGGAIVTFGAAVDAVDLTVNGTLFQGNRATNNAGAVLAGGDGFVLMKGVKAIGNTANNGGGGAMQLDSTVSINIAGSLFRGNAADGDGGGIAVGAPLILVTGSKFLDNFATSGNGGAILFTTVTNATLSKSIISGNFASAMGGGVRNDAATAVKLVGNTIGGNFAPTGANTSGMFA